VSAAKVKTIHIVDKRLSFSTVHPHVYFFLILDFEIPNRPISLQPRKEPIPRRTLSIGEIVLSHRGVAPTLIGVALVLCVAPLIFVNNHRRSL
jgi:hypothetical protein